MSQRPSEADLTACENEPIRIPGSIQPHGALLVLDADQRIVQASANAGAWLEAAVDPATGPLLAEVLPAGWEELGELLRDWSDSDGRSILYDAGRHSNGATALAHRVGDLTVVEFEQGVTDRAAIGRLQGRLQAYIEQITATEDVATLCGLAARHIRELIGFNRVMVYRFGADWTGTVVSEENDGVLPSYLDLRFPAADIPAQARELYRLNRVRIIPDCDYVPVPILPAAGTRPDGPLDLSHATLRSVSPVHLEYMRNMGTPASMSVSILVEGRLWGLISCHHAQARHVSLRVRNACDFLVQVMAVQLGALIRTEDSRRRMALAPIQGELLAAAASKPVFTDGLTAAPRPWLGMVHAAGAAWVAHGEVETAGRAPSHAQVNAIVDWLKARGSPAFYSSDHLAQDFPEAEAFADTASGLIAIHVSELHPSYLLWFRPEMVFEVTWGGDPHKAAAKPGERLTPRASFDAWKELVRNRATPWAQAELETASDFRRAVLSLVLRQAEERAELTKELQRSNRELEAFSYSISHDLRAPFRHITGYAELLQEREPGLDETSLHYIAGIRDAAVSAGRLVDDLLRFSQIGRAQLATGSVDMNKIAAEAQRSLGPDVEGRAIQWRIGKLPNTFGDAAMLRQVMINLLSNAAKYTRPRSPAEISVSAVKQDGEVVYSVTDNGVGFDMAYANKLFGVFQRLHRGDEFEGTGIGLAITQRVVERHGGRIWAEGRLGKGATFHFALPIRKIGERPG